MEMPPLDHVGWGRLLGAVMESGTAPERTTSASDTSSSGTDMPRIRRRERLERSIVTSTNADVYA